MKPCRVLGSCAWAFASTVVLVSTLSPSARADPLARAQAETIVTSVEARPADRTLTAALVGRARHALTRATQARNAGDQQHGSELEALALEIAETARDLLRAVEAEKKLSELEQRSLDIETRVVRARALVEQAAARRGRAAEQLRAAEAEKTPAPSKAPVPKGTPGPAAGERRMMAPKLGNATTPAQTGAASKPAVTPPSGGNP